MRRSIFLVICACTCGCGTTKSNANAGPSDASADASGITDANAGDSSSGGMDASAGSFRILAFQAPVAPAGDARYAAVAASGVVTGPVIEVMWKSIDTAGVFDWSSFDGPTSEIAHYLATYPAEQFSILFEPASDNLQNIATPIDVLTSAGQQICFCDGVYAGDKTGTNSCFVNGKVDGVTQDLTGLPVPFTGSFATRWQSFISAAIARLNAATYRSQILYVTFGVSNGGEDIPRCPAEETTLAGTKAALSTAWIQNLDAQDSAIQAAAPTFPVVVGTSCLGAMEPPDGSTTNDDCATFADLEAKTNAARGVGIRVTTLQHADLLAYAENTPAVSDWIANTAAYPNVPIVWQTSAESDPSGTGTAACIRNGSLAELVPFVTAHSSPQTPLRVLEIYNQDLEGTYASGYQDACWPVGIVTSDPYAPYDTVFKTAIATQ